ncbi:hypothetical protein SUDANB145_07305 (plasmid) [Streptomyces sp. enrichment culture]|uniref:hypothetical protein n=1 Tax=Streptomyces sp. enrichment culture TaxID=1795815 RepID=UPI003F575B0F
MSQIPVTASASDDLPEPSPRAGGAGGEGVGDAGFETMRTDAVLTGRAMSSGAYLAGLLLAAQVDTAGTVRKLPVDCWPDVDPVVVQEIWDRACAVVYRAAQFAQAPRLHGDRLQDLQGRLAEAGFHAMAGSVGRSRRLVARSHPADGEIVRERD